MYILGINAYHGDAAAALVCDGKLIAAVEEERFNRVKHCAGFPAESVRYCLRAAGIGIEEVEHVGISRDPSAHLHKKVLFAAKRLTKSSRQKGIANFGFRNSDFVRGLTSTVSTTQSADMPDVLPRGNGGNGNGNNGNGRGFFRGVKDRLNNAAKVHDLRDDLAKVLGVSSGSLRAQFHNIEHHRAHLASSFYVSPFDRAALLSIDGFGDFVSTMWGVGEGNSIKVLDQVEYPHSTGILYTATTQFLGFPHYGDEGKVMGLAPYGRPRYIEEFRDIIQTRDRGQFRLNLDYFRHHAEGVEMTWDQGSPLIGQIYSDSYTRLFGAPRTPTAPLTEREQDIAASLQLRLEEVGFHVLNHLYDETGVTDLGLSGGVAYNSVMNGKILLHTPFRRIFVQPAAGDSGTALGVCYEIQSRMAPAGSPASVKQSVRLRSDAGEVSEVDSLCAAAQANSLRYGLEQSVRLQSDVRAISEVNDAQPTQTNSLRYGVEQSVRLQSDVSEISEVNDTQPTQTDNLRYVMQGAYTGPDFQSTEICAELDVSNLQYESYTDEDVTKRAARDIADGLVVGWFQGRMEFGPRALGNRSIVVDSRRLEMKGILNDRIKRREAFRPFAPSILEERTADYFEQSHPSPTMLMVYQVRPERRAEIPAVTHVDGSSRVQTVSREVNSRYYQLISDFNDLTGVPVILNTSFNENEPIVCTPRHAIDCFIKTRMDVLYLGNFAIRGKR